MRRILLTALILWLALPLASCRKDPQQVLADLETEIAELPLDPADRKEAIQELLEEIREYENEEHEKHVQVLIEKAADGIFRESGDGTVFVARTGSDWTVLHNAGLHEFQEGDKPEDFSLSFNGRFIVYAVKEAEEKCRFGWIDLGVNRDSVDHRPDFMQEACSTPIAPGNDGSVYISRSRDIFQRSMPDGEEKLILGRAFFKPAFSKITNRIVLVPVPEGVWLLFGAAGHYDLYHYAGTPGRARKVYPGIASPLVQFAAAGLFTEAEQGKDILFLYTGGAGRYRLQGFTLPDTTWKSFQVPVRRHITYLRKEDQFLFVKDGYPIRYVASTGKESRLPLRVRSIFVHGRGLVYLDERNRLLLRTEPYSEYEKKLFQLKEELEQNLRK